MRDPHPGTGGAGKRHHVHVRVFGQRFADFRARPADQVEHPGRQADVLDHLRQQEGMQRGFLARLDHHGATGGQGRGEFADQLVQRVIPRVDERADTHGLADHQRIADFAHLVHQMSQFDVLLKASDRPVDLHRAAPLHRHAQFRCDDRGHLIGTIAQLIGQCTDITGTHAGRRARP
ncbi:hypothetical protein D3C80_554820 [compost metagenome]